MSREDELAVARDQVSIIAEQAARLLDIIACRNRLGSDATPAEEKLALLEARMWKLQKRYARLRAEAAAGQRVH